MAKKSKKRINQTGGTASKRRKLENPAVDGQMPSSSPRRRAKFRRYAIWSISGLLVAIAVVAAWTAFQNISHGSSEPTSINQSQATAPAANSGDNPVSGGPQISFPETSFDFGTITQGSKASHTFIVRNTGNAPLKLIKAQGT